MRRLALGLRKGKRMLRPFSAAHPRKIGGAKRPRVYSKASPLQGSQIKDLLSDSGL